jgi:hypothetical protein
MIDAQVIMRIGQVPFFAKALAQGIVSPGVAGVFRDDLP